MKDYKMARIDDDRRTGQRPSLWANDKYPDMPRLHAGSKVVLLDICGPGVVTSIHSTRFSPRLKDEIWNWDSKYIRDVIVRVWYDHMDVPAVEMPFYDFLGDIEGDCGYYSTVYFSKVRRAGNFRLLMPFREHIRIELENPTDVSLSGLIDVQYDTLGAFPEDMGYLNIAYVNGSVNIPDGRIELCNIPKGGHIIANWLQLECDDRLCAEGAVMCEGNDEFFLDGESEPALEYLGTEDCFGFSWGFDRLESDFYNAIIKKEALKGGGAKIGVLRCRDNDRISFRKSCRLVLDYTHEINPDLRGLNPDIKAALDKGGLDMNVRSCVYYYSG